ncbi:MBL fold metallo-hydrolase, partial [Candidatus Bathyarchaeota archaeon]|nr:MBL fold metallo-hydrolase [Candidatus Bathyarchaeota archaeon]
MSIPKSKHFQLQRLADGVYAAVASERGYAICNAGIIDTGDRTIVFDTFISPEATKDLLRAAKRLTPQNNIRVVNSHYHNDHIRGNQVFPPDVDILSTATTFEGIAHKEPEEIKWEKENLPKAIVDTKSKLRMEKDPKRRHDLALSIVYYEAIMKSHPKLKTRLPNITFEGSLTIHGTRRQVELLTLAGHTASDLVLYLPDEKIAFMSDLLFVNNHPYLAGCSPKRWRKSLREIGKLGVQTLVPGHGPVGSPSDLSLLDQYIQTLESIARNMVKMGKSPEEVR